MDLLPWTNFQRFVERQLMKSPNQYAVVRQTIFGNGICAADLLGMLARYRSVFAGTGGQANHVGLRAPLKLNGQWPEHIATRMPGAHGYPIFFLSDA
jgi:hypothetical protein